MKKFLSSPSLVFLVLLAACAPASSPAPSDGGGGGGGGSGARWAKTVVAGPSDSRFNAVASDALGHTYAAGSLQGTGEYDFGNGVKVHGSSSGSNAVLVKYGPTGMALWASVPASGNADSEYRGVAVNNLGQVFAVGSLWNRIDVDFGAGTDPLTVAKGSYSGGKNSLIVKYNGSDGKAVWARSTAASGNYHWFSGVTADGSGNAYAVGMVSYLVACNFGTAAAPVTAQGPCSADNPVIVKYSASGEALWARTTTGISATPAGVTDSSSEFLGVTLNSLGHLVAAGTLHGFKTLYFGPGQTIGAGYADGGGYLPLVVQYDTGGTALWAKTVTDGPNSAFFSGIDCDTTGNVYAVGKVMGTGTFGFGNSVTAAGSYDGDCALVVKYDDNGSAQWARTPASAPEYSAFTAVAVDPLGSLWAAGTLDGSGAFGFGAGVLAQGSDPGGNPVLVEYSLTGTPKDAFSTTSGASAGKAQGTRFLGVALDNLGRPVAVGSLAGRGPYSFGGASVQGPAADRLHALAVQFP